jgi:hypothetical protein
MALPNSPFAGTNKGAAPQVARPVGAQLQVSNVRRVIGNNVHSGYSLPHGAGFLQTNLIHRSGTTIAVHQYLYKGKVHRVIIPVKTSPRRGAIVTPVKMAPQTVQGF